MFPIVPYENDHNLLGGIQSIFRHLVSGLRTVGQVNCLPSGSFCCRLGPLLTPTTWECSWGVVSMGRTMVTTSTSWDRYILYRLCYTVIQYTYIIYIYHIHIHITPIAMITILYIYISICTWNCTPKCLEDDITWRTSSHEPFLLTHTHRVVLRVDDLPSIAFYNHCIAISVLVSSHEPCHQKSSKINISLSMNTGYPVVDNGGI